MSFLIKAALIVVLVSPSASNCVIKSDEITIPINQIIDWRVDDIKGDGSQSLLIIKKRDDSDTYLYDAVYRDGRADEFQAEGETEAQNRDFVYGNDFLICEYSGDTSDLMKQDGSVRVKRLFSMDFTTIRPISVKTGDINGDGVNEISICVFKTTAFHPVYAKRPFVYRYNSDGNSLEPVWLGSRLSRPFDDYLFADINGDGIDELVSIESVKSGYKVVTCYNWHDFGFYKLGESPEYENILSIKAFPIQGDEFVFQTVGMPAIMESVVYIDGDVKTLRFAYVENENADPSEDYGRLELLDYE